MPRSCTGRTAPSTRPSGMGGPRSASSTRRAWRSSPERARGLSGVAGGPRRRLHLSAATLLAGLPMVLHLRAAEGQTDRCGPMRITFSVEGGFAGLARGATVDTDDLDAKE